MVGFPVRHLGVYTAADSSTSLCIGPTAVWQQELRQWKLSRHRLDSLPCHFATDSTYQDALGRLHHLHLVGTDSLRDTWLEQDTIFNLAGSRAGHLRKFQGRYYLNTPETDAGEWQVQRLTITGRRLLWQTLGQDTLRLLALDAATVRRQLRSGAATFRLAPAAGQQTRRVGSYAGLWETADEFTRRH